MNKLVRKIAETFKRLRDGLGVDNMEIIAFTVLAGALIFVLVTI